MSAASKGGSAGADCCPSRRDFIHLAGASAAAALTPPALAAGRSHPAPILVDLSPIEPSQQVEVRWNNRRIFIRRRTKAEIALARATPLSLLPDPQPDSARVKHPEWLIVFGECTHAGCRPHEGMGDYGGWKCLCHGSQFDISGRVRKGPAEVNLEIPNYRFRRRNVVEIGVSRTASSRASRS